LNSKIDSDGPWSAARSSDGDVGDVVGATAIAWARVL
jgi:hypothetical protein